MCTSSVPKDDFYNRRNINQCKPKKRPSTEQHWGIIWQYEGDCTGLVTETGAKQKQKQKLSIASDLIGWPLN